MCKRFRMICMFLKKNADAVCPLRSCVVYDDKKVRLNQCNDEIFFKTKQICSEAKLQKYKYSAASISKLTKQNQFLQFIMK